MLDWLLTPFQIKYKSIPFLNLKEPAGLGRLPQR